MLLFVLTALVWAVFLGIAAFLSRSSKGTFLCTGAVQKFSTFLWRQTGKWAQHPRWCMFTLVVGVLVLRLIALPVFGAPPDGRSHDEYSFILAGQTFAAGRITNPTPALWQFFETPHVLMHPTYMSKYPPIQGLFIALGILLGNMWFGILLSYVLMLGAIYWMAQAYLPPRWALFAGVLPLIHPNITSYWANSYFGGAASAIGGALVLGACGRLYRSASAGNFCVLATGILVVANTRLFEGSAAIAPPLMVLAYLLVIKRRYSWKSLLQCLLLPSVLLISGCAAMLYYNYQITGNALVMPYMESQRQYSAIPLLMFSKMGEIPHYNSQMLYNNYFTSDFVKYSKFLSLNGWLDVTINDRFIGMQQFYVGLTLIPTAFATWLSLKDRKMTVLWMTVIATCAAISITAVAFERHYLAPATAAIEVLLIQGLRHMRLMKWRGVRVGISLARIFCAVCFVGFLTGLFTLNTAQKHIQQAQDEFPRVAFLNKLRAVPGKHLVVVHYAEGHDPRREYVINEPDLDKARIVWARDLGAEQDKALLKHFQDRQVWVFDPDHQPEPQLYTWEEAQTADLSKKVDDSSWMH